MDTEGASGGSSRTHLNPGESASRTTDSLAAGSTSFQDVDQSAPNLPHEQIVSSGSGSGADPSAQAESSSVHTQVEVYGPALTPASTTPSDLDPAYFEPTLSDVQAHHASVLARSHRLNEAPLLTAKFRDADKAEKEKKKAEKWPTTTIRIKFSDGTMIQRTFPSSSPIQPVYEFVRTSLDPSASTKPFVLWQPPRFHYPEHPIPAKKENPHKAHIIAPASYGNIKGGPTQGLQGGTGGKESLSHLGLVPQSVLLIKWTEDKMNASGYKAPLRSDLLEKIVPLPPAQPKEEMSTKPSPASASATGAGNSTGEKKIPKWLQKGLLKKK